MMTDDQFKEIKRRSTGNSQCETWYKIFQLLFPNARRPISPYVSTCDPDTVQHFVKLFQLVGPQELFRLIQDRRERGQESAQLGASTQAIVDEAFEIALPDYLERLECNQQCQSEQIGISESSGQQAQGRQSDSSVSRMNGGLTVAPQAIADHPFLMPQAAHTNTCSALQPGWNVQHVTGSPHPMGEPLFHIPQALPSEITQIFHPFEALLGGVDVEAGGLTSNVDTDFWANVSV